MTMRKPDHTQKISELKNEIDTVEKFMAPKVKEAENLDALRKIRHLTIEELRRADELIEYIHDKNCWLVKARAELEAFYKPAVA